MCWFKASATDHTAKAYEMVFILEANGVYVNVTTTSHPGYVVYEDEHQVAAEPFADVHL